LNVNRVGERCGLKSGSPEFIEFIFVLDGSRRDGINSSVASADGRLLCYWGTTPTSQTLDSCPDTATSILLSPLTLQHSLHTQFPRYPQYCSSIPGHHFFAPRKRSCSISSPQTCMQRRPGHIRIATTANLSPENTRRAPTTEIHLRQMF
jgi:hypothetical protein